MTNIADTLNSNAGYASDLRDRMREAADVSASWDVVLRPSTKCIFLERARTARTRIGLLKKSLSQIPREQEAKDSQQNKRLSTLLELRSSQRLLSSAVLGVTAQPKLIASLPRIVQAHGPDEPRVAMAARLYLHIVRGNFMMDSFRDFICELQARDPFLLEELWTFTSLLRFAILELLLDEAFAFLQNPLSSPDSLLETYLGSLRLLSTSNLIAMIEHLIAFDSTLRKDPISTYSRMDFDSREFYRKRVAFFARYSDCTECEVAEIALRLAQECASASLDDERQRHRQAHVGYYLVDQGVHQLTPHIGFHGPLIHRTRSLVRANAEDFYISGIHFFTVLILCAVLFPLLPHASSLTGLLIAALILWIPAMQVAVELVNYATSLFLPPSPLPKLDFSKGIDSACVTLVAVPSLLLNEKQIHDLVTELEIRYLANRDPNLHFALLTDLPDSMSKPHENDAHPLLDLAIRLIDELNAKYGPAGAGVFMLLHRRRVFNTRQGVWMGWERKRGKLLDLNKLLAQEYDAFPVKAGNLAPLSAVRYVLTLDSDTQLPRGTAARLIGAIAHPLNQAVIDPSSRIVTAGYGILQPRIGVNVRSTAKSRLAAIFSGQNGFDIYTRAISDPYQDLFGEGIFTGKGIYEVKTLHSVLDRRFPRNALLSHDLIEGSYTRAGLAQDIELIDDYPSHYSAYSRRKHRWVRGDWQIAQWMFSRVPDESGHWVKNPIPAISRWKIFDNLRRSLVDPFLFLLFLTGWLFLPGGPLYWTIIPLVLLIVPSLIQFLVGLARSIIDRRHTSAADVLAGFSRSIFLVVFNLVFLLHQTLLSLDAIVRSMVRGFITGERLLEWETAEQAESAPPSQTPADRYLAWMPAVTVVLAILIWFGSAHSTRQNALLISAPILLLWSLATFVTLWINRPRHEWTPLAQTDEDTLRDHAFLIWRYFRDFSGPSHNYLVPDNVEEQNLYEAPRVSPTNIGLLLNARLAAVELGFLTTPEFAGVTLKTLATIAKLNRFRGHLFNWYDTTSLQPLDSSPIVSTVDSGNFVASLIALHAGALSCLQESLIAPQLLRGVRTLWRRMHAEWKIAARLKHLPLPATSVDISRWLDWLLASSASLCTSTETIASFPEEAYWVNEMQERITDILTLIRDYSPWLLPEFAALSSIPGGHRLNNGVELTIAQALLFASCLHHDLDEVLAELPDESSQRELATRFQLALASSVHNLRSLESELHSIARQAVALANETEFAFLVNPDRQMLSIGYNVGAHRLLDSCYDMIASEARIAAFLAIARGDIPLQSWSRLSREHTRVYGSFALLSWTGTIFEYLMPTLWMRNYPGTLIMQTQVASVGIQRAFARTYNIPWGISESGFAQTDDSGHYQYRAFGIPALALSPQALAGPVVSPYSTFLALGVERDAALTNLRHMASSGWIGRYGFYEAADYSGSRNDPVLVREWMAHHLGMSLLAITNTLHKNIFQQWFHTSSLVRSAELLLHEIPVSKAVLNASLQESS